MPDTAPTPIFLHSLFRTASTYFFHKFRCLGPDFTCYQEPFNESLDALNHPSRQARLLRSPHGSTLRHPRLDRPYFQEFWDRRASLQGLYQTSFAYREYFIDLQGRLPPGQHRYLSALLEQASGRPVLQCCRSAGRVLALRRAFGGTHVHLWREPRAQWWSYKVVDYLDNVSRRIYEAQPRPDALHALAVLAGAEPDGPKHLRPRDNYLLFYGLWLDAWLHLQAHTQLSVSIDSLGIDPAARATVARSLSELAGRDIDLSDIRDSGMAFAAEEEEFYGEVERTVQDVFVQTRRATPSAVESAHALACAVRRRHAAGGHHPSAERNVRLAALEMMERLARQEQRQRAAWPRRLLRALRAPLQPRAAVVTQSASARAPRGLLGEQR